MNQYQYMFKVMSVVLLYCCIVGCPKSPDEEELGFETITDTQALVKRVRDNPDREIYVLFYSRHFPDTYKISTEILRFAGKRTSVPILLDVPVGDAGWEVGEEFNLKGMPTLIVFKDGKEFVRLNRYRGIKKWLDESMKTNEPQQSGHEEGKLNPEYSRMSAEDSIRFETIPDTQALAKWVRDNPDREIYVLFHSRRIPETYEISTEILQFAGKKTSVPILLDVPVGNVGWEVGDEFDLKVTPTLIVFKEGKEVARLSLYSGIKKWLDESTMTNEPKQSGPEDAELNPQS